ncbi:MAG TPA: AraC family transcriptional regulator [Caulobacteraceae bacterium]|jgi:AraC-like DNA-binding protein
MPELTIAAGIARGLMRFAVLRGASQDALVERSGIDPKNLADQDARVPLSRYIALMKAGQALSGDAALALHYAEAIDFSEISIVGLITLASETMTDAFIQMNRFGRLAVEWEGEGDRFRLSREGDGHWVTDTRRNPNAFPELTETTFGRMACGTRAFGDTRFIEAVEVTHPDPGYRDEYERIFQAPVTFEAGRNALRLNEAWATYKIARQPRYVFGILSDHARALLEKLASAQTTRGRVESLLMPGLHTGDASMPAIAAKLGLSRQTLFRRLKAEGVTFEKILDGLRHQMALNYLSGAKVSVNETAYLVGFSDPAAFSRAFKRWTGASPKAMRDAASASL